MGTLRERGVRSRIKEEIYMYCAFWIAVSALPAIAISYVVVKVSKHLWLKILSSRYPRLEFIQTDTIRSLLDTHRNQGIINVLLTIKGTLNTEQIKQHLMQQVVERRDKNGEIMFPRLRQLLVSCWGRYAWNSTHIFRPEHHFIVANGVYRGRPVTDNNIQDYVSEIISKYFPIDQPPWQYIIIPCISTEPKYFILVRVHHLLLSGEKSINIGDLLLIEQLATAERTTRLTEHSQESPLAKLFPVSSVLPELLEKLSESLSNAWNEFISEYDPVESPRALKTLPGAFHVAGLVLISSASVLREVSKRRNSRDPSPITPTFIIAAIRRECNRRNLNLSKILLSPLVTIDPRKWPRRTFRITLTTAKTAVQLPSQIRDEVCALVELKNTGMVSQPKTFTWKYAGLAQLCVKAVTEIWQALLDTYRAPGKLWSEVIGVDDGKRHILQTVSLCGRKVISWSRPVSRAGIERAARALEVSATDVAMYAVTESIRAYFEQTENEAPEAILITARAASEDFLYTRAEGKGKEYKKSQTGGMVCVPLPLGASPRRVAATLCDAASSQGALSRACVAQTRHGAITRAIPAPFAKMALNILSRRYAVSYAEIMAPADARPRYTSWKQTVESVIYWRPPQANISMSLTVIQYADTVRLAVMTDARLTPGHTIPAVRWPVAIEQLVTKIDQELARIAAQTQQTVETHAPTASEENVGTSSYLSNLGISSFSSTLKPPDVTAVSPPPLRRRKTHQ